MSGTESNESFVALARSCRRACLTVIVLFQTVVLYPSIEMDMS